MTQEFKLSDALLKFIEQEMIALHMTKIMQQTMRAMTKNQTKVADKSQVVSFAKMSVKISSGKAASNLSLILNEYGHWRGH